jgi:hypothetical protein
VRMRTCGPIGGVLGVGASALALAAATAAFTGTPAALKLVHRMRAAYQKLPAVENVRTGQVFYCPAASEGWGYAPRRHCNVRARVHEEYDLSNGRIVRVIGQVRAHGLPTLRYVDSKRGWYRIAAGQSCWQRANLPFVNPLLVDFPFAGERLAVTQRTRTRTILQGVSARGGYREIDYIANKTFFEYRSVEITRVPHAVHRLIDHLRVQSRPTGAIPTPTCG